MSRLAVHAAMIAVLGFMAGCEHKRTQAVETAPPIVMVALPVERTITDFQIFTARTQAVQSVDVKARVTGYLTKINFKDGADVKEGDVLFEIDDRPYKAALDSAVAALEFAQASLVQTQAQYDIGLAVQKQNVGAISQQELTKRLGARDEAKANIDSAKASLENAKLNLGWCKVTAPIAGRANTHFVDQGNIVTKDVTTLTNLVSLKPMWAYFDVDQNSVERYQRLIKSGEVPSARTSEIPIHMAIGADAGYALSGTIDFVSNQLDPNTGSIRVRGVFPNTDGSLVSGLFTRIRVPVSGAHQGLLVNEQAIGTDQGHRYILVVNEKNIVEFRIIDVGQTHDGLREVKRNRSIRETNAQGKDVDKEVEVLKPTDRIIVDGLQRARPGAAVNPKLVDMQTLLPVSGTDTKSASPTKSP